MLIENTIYFNVGLNGLLPIETLKCEVVTIHNNPFYSVS